MKVIFVEFKCVVLTFFLFLSFLCLPVDALEHVKLSNTEGCAESTNNPITMAIVIVKADF